MEKRSDLRDQVERQLRGRLRIGSFTTGQGYVDWQNLYEKDGFVVCIYSWFGMPIVPTYAWRKATDDGKKNTSYRRLVLLHLEDWNSGDPRVGDVKTIQPSLEGDEIVVRCKMMDGSETVVRYTYDRTWGFHDESGKRV